MSFAPLFDACAIARAAQTLSGFSNHQEELSHAITEAESPIRLTVKHAPFPYEIAKGIPANFIVKEVTRRSGRTDKYYLAPDGTCFRSVKEVLRSKH